MIAHAPTRAASPARPGDSDTRSWYSIEVKQCGGHTCAWLCVAVLGCGRVRFETHDASSSDAAMTHHGSTLALDRVDPGESLADYPLLVTLDDTRADRAAIRADGSNVRFYGSNGSLLGAEIEQIGIPGGPPLLAWVFLPHLQGLATSITVTYDESPADGPTSSAWPPAYIAVWHLDGPGRARDATSNQHDATAVGTLVTPGVFAGARAFGGDGKDHLIVADTSTIVLNAGFTTSAWIKRGTTVQEFEGVITRQQGETDKNDVYLGVSNGMGYAECTTATLDVTLAAGSVPQGAWTHLVATADSVGQVETIYVDGEAVGQTPFTGFLMSGAQPLFIGADRSTSVGPATDPDDDYFDGVIDEPRIENVVRDAAWIRFDEHAQRDEVITYGSPTEDL